MEFHHHLFFKDKKSFERFFKQYYAKLCNYASSIIYDDEEAEDIVQEVFINVWERKESIRLEASPELYLFRAVKFKSIDHLRKKSKEKNLFQLPAEEDKNDSADELLQKLYIEIDKLPPRCREIFLKHRIEGLSHKAIADQLSISKKTVENQIVKALKLLRSAIYQLVILFQLINFLYFFLLA